MLLVLLPLWRYACCQLETRDVWLVGGGGRRRLAGLTGLQQAVQ